MLIFQYMRFGAPGCGSWTKVAWDTSARSTANRFHCGSPVASDMRFSACIHFVK